VGSSRVVFQNNFTYVPTTLVPSIYVGTLMCNSSSGGGHVTKKYRISIDNPPVGYSVSMGSSFGAAYSIGTDSGGYYLYMDFTNSVSTSGAATVNLNNSSGTMVAYYTGIYTNSYISALPPC
jgi:hypothetical protein